MQAILGNREYGRVKSSCRVRHTQLLINMITILSSEAPEHNLTVVVGCVIPSY